MTPESTRGTDEARRQISEDVASTVTSGRALFAIVSAARRVQDRYNETLEPFDLSLAQYQLLDFLRRVGPAGADAEAFHGGMRDLCVSTSCEAHVERNGWLVRDHGGTRNITETGRQLLAELAPVLEELSEQIAGGLGINQLAQLMGLTAHLEPEVQ